MQRNCRSEERRVGKECRSRWSPDHYKKKKTKKRKKGDCEDLSFYLSDLLDESGINNKVVFGHGNIEDIENERLLHAWVEYKLNEVTYILDPQINRMFKRKDLDKKYYVEMKDKDIERKIKRYRKRAYPKK